MKLVNIEGMPNFEVKTADGKEYVLLPFKHLYDIPTVPAIPIDRVKQVREQIIDEKDFSYADFERYKEEVLHVESDELPDDDFRFGMERCLKILDVLIAENEI